MIYPFPKVIARSSDTNDFPYFYTKSHINQPLPTFFYFSLTAQESLQKDPFNQIIAAIDHLPIRCVSISMPDHDSSSPDEALKIWEEKILEGKDLVKPFIQRCQFVLEDLLAKGLTDQTKIACGGLSRGAFFASHLMATDLRFQWLIALAPLSDFGKAKDYNNLANHPFSTNSCLIQLSEQLCDRSLFITIGNQDERVNTDSCMMWINSLLSKSKEKEIRSPKIHFKLYPSIGYLGHGTPPEIFVEAAHWLTKQWKLTPLFNEGNEKH